MNTPVTQLLVQFSDALAAHVAAAAPLVTAIRIGTNRVISGIVWRADVVVTSDQALPAQDSYSLAVAAGMLLPARAARRDPATNLVCLNLDTPAVTVPIRAASDPAVGSLALALGAAVDGTPTARLTAIHRIVYGHASRSGALGDAIMLDLAGALLPEGGPVLDMRGGLLGMASAGPSGEALVIPYATIARFLDPLGMVKALPSAHHVRRGWLGVALQPITVPELLRSIAGQNSGRMVVGVTSGGPAEHAGLRLGDVLLAIDGQSVSGQQGLRAFIGADRIGSAIEIRLMRDGAVRNATLIVAPQPLD
ncbi:MAG TPA: PDZ domain-containing protein [Acetobacteraceae bacterium]|nr:PDZ domain-containing protein [Acetobacteraceae bacterium]